ncbi:zinc finger SWIM domain-containing protein 8-like [Tachypleus tridentatus]|uniref:zinc finger SWIM domain-containing protein 8-like n=1 Tax=Tachypleus tridentatus TaxID=6853 RepID=UPI003FD3A806
MCSQPQITCQLNSRLTVEVTGMFDWDEGDRFSFEDSDRFEEDSLCSWISEPESLCNNWRGWKKPNGNNYGYYYNHSGHFCNKEGQHLSLVELAAKEVAANIPFEVVERVYPPVPEQLQLRIAFWSFPENEEDIRLYSCLANGSADEFQRGEHLFKARAVKELLQIGFHLSATLLPSQNLPICKGSYSVAVTFDRCRITSCTCTCNSAASWCSHVVAVCLQRIHQPNQVRLRAPVSESLSRLHREQLQKFAQYLISELPQQILPTAQRLLDELLSNQQTPINKYCGAPDPTAGASASELTTWCLDEGTLHENIKKILIKLCVPSPMVFSDVNYLSSTAPPAAAEWSSLLRPLRGREPEGIWNLLLIVREMFCRSDRNAIPLLQILTEEVLACDQILVWWFNTKMSLHMGCGGHGSRGSVHSNTHASQQACSSLCDEVVILWRLAGLNPALSPQERQNFFCQLRECHLKTLERVWKVRNNSGSGASGIKRSDIDVFTGFKPAMEACLLDWSDYPIEGVTYTGKGASRWYVPYTQGRGSDHSVSCMTSKPSDFCHVNNRRGRSVDVSSCIEGRLHSRLAPPVHRCSQNSGKICSESNRSSLSSEGFCENETEPIENFTQFSGPIPSETKVPITVNIQLPYGENMSNDSSGNLQLHLCEDSSRKTEVLCTGIVPKIHSEFSDLTLKSSCMDETGESSNPPEVGIAKELEKSSPEEDSDWSNPPEDNCQAGKSRTQGDENSEQNESQQSSDEYQVYYYSPQAILPSPEKVSETKTESERFTVSVKKIEDPLEVLFARAEALHAHGHTQEACKLAVKLAEELLANPPNFVVDMPAQPNRGKRNRRFNPACHQISLHASATLSKAAFLCSVLGENPDHSHLAFRVGLFGLELARPPASTKALEVKMANQEQELVGLLKRIMLTDAELKVVRERAEQLRSGLLQSRGEALLPLMLSSFIFDALVLCGPSSGDVTSMSNKSVSDEELGFEAAVAALGLKANVSEADHPILCEGTRRQRGELALTLLVHYKDDQQKLSKIMNKLLDKEDSQSHKNQAQSTYYTPTSCTDSTTTVQGSHSLEHGEGETNKTAVLFGEKIEDEQVQEEAGNVVTPEDIVSRRKATSHLGLPKSHNKTSGARAKESHRHRNRERGDSEGASSPGWEEDYKAWEAKFRCTNFHTSKKHSAGMASIDSSAPETTSSDNSPTVVRRSTWIKTGGPGSDSGSSGESSNSFVSSSSGDKGTRNKTRDSESPSQVNRFEGGFPAGDSLNRHVTTTVKPTRFKGKRAYPNVPNQPSEASAHFMFELAKTVLTKAGGNSSTAVLFTQPSAGQNHRGPHRALHICAFQIGLYALKLHNAVSPNWLSRTYSSHVSWITGQAMEIGSLAIKDILIDSWEGHLTPPEVASLADRASRVRDPAMVRAAAELALSCLPHAHALNPNEIQRALIQCKEQCVEMLERACLAVESAAKGGGVYPEVLFDVAHRWYELYEETLQGQQDHISEPHGFSADMTFGHSTTEQSGTPVSSAAETLAMLTTCQVEGMVTTTPTVQVFPQLSCQPVSYSLPYPAPPYGYIQGVPSPFPHGPVPLHPAYLPPPPTYAYPALASASYYPSTYTSTVAGAVHVRHTTPGLYTGQLLGVPVTQAAMTQPRPVLPVSPSPPPSVPPPQQPQVHNPISQLNQRQLNYLLAAYRVGMLAMETLARRVHDDRPQAKYARTPPYGEDVKWLLGVAKKLGTSYLHDFCICTVNSVTSPFVLHDLVLDAAHYLSLSSSSPMAQGLRSHLLTPLIQKCQQMFIACTHFKMYHITPAEYEEFVNIIRKAKSAFQLTPGGMVQFSELLQSLRRSKSCKKELWQKISSVLVTSAI